MESKALSSVVNLVDESGPASLQEIMKHRKTQKCKLIQKLIQPPHTRDKIIHSGG